MDFVNINPGLKTGLRQAFTITMQSRIFFLTYDAGIDTIIWNMFMDDFAMKEKIEEILKNYLTNQ
jgi:hypothetical protein